MFHKVNKEKDLDIYDAEIEESKVENVCKYTEIKIDENEEVAYKKLKTMW